ncbi:hypothetical protein XbC2_340 [Xanthomonas phage XbC2]|nr:hypothetical protein XbC2_340 [Xanthomonas phage XbC2]
MKLGTAIVLAVVAVLVLGFLGTVGMYTSTNNTANKFEANIKRLDLASQNQLSNYTMKVQEQAQIPAMYADDLQKTLKAYFEGRNKDETYIRSFVQQNMPNLSPKMYETLMVTIDAGREAFKNAQNKKTDVCSDYEEYRGRIWTSTFLSAKYPGNNIEKLCTIVTDDRTAKAFETHRQEVIKLH